jgi:hypothetical protein
MHGVRSRRVAGCVVLVGLLSACHGGGATSVDSSGQGRVDVKAACAALADLQRAGAVLNGVDVGDPAASLAALGKAVDAYSTALATFERVGPGELRPRAAAVRSAVLTRHFAQATVARAQIDAWAAQHCSS